MSSERLAVTAATLVAAAILVGCSGDNSDDSSGQASGTEQKVIEINDQPGSVEGYEGALDDAEMESCEVEGGSLHVSGTVTNPASEVQDYRIYVSALEGGDTQGLVQVDTLGVEGGETAEWSTDIDLSGDEFECVLRVERFASE